MRAAIFQQANVTGRIDALVRWMQFRMATLEGAKAMGLDDHVGSLEAGKRADVVGGGLEPSRDTAVYDRSRRWSIRPLRADVRTVLLGGPRSVVGRF